MKKKAVAQPQVPCKEAATAFIAAIPQEEKELYGATMISADALAEQGNRKKRSGKIADPHIS